MDIFAQATRQKMRFETTSGCLSVEDLWDLPLRTSSFASRRPNLDDIARAAYKAVQEAHEISFVEDLPPEDTLAELKFAVVKAIIEVKKAERQAAMAKAAQEARKAKLLEVLARKQDAALEGYSVEELQEMIAAL